jgi:prevent-host-death family protein
MPERETKTQTMKLTDARQNFSQVLNQVFRENTRVLVEKSGIPVAGIVSAKDLERLNQLDEQQQADFAILDEIGEAFRGIPAEEIDREVAIALAAARKEIRAQRERASQST